MKTKWKHLTPYTNYFYKADGSHKTGRFNQNRTQAVHHLRPDVQDTSKIGVKQVILHKTLGLKL
jgi:hypothetical protein